MTQTLIILTILLSFILPTTAQQQLDKYLLLATNRTGTMEKELNEAGERGLPLCRYPRWSNLFRWQRSCRHHAVGS